MNRAASGVPFSDESRPRGDAYEYALSRMGAELPFVHVGRAMRYLGITENVATRPEDLSKRQVETDGVDAVEAFGPQGLGYGDRHQREHVETTNKGGCI